MRLQVIGHGEYISHDATELYMYKKNVLVSQPDSPMARTLSD